MVPDTIAVGKGYALWLTPAEPAFGSLARHISRLSREHSTPRFEPHVTLLSRILLPEGKALAYSGLLGRMLRPMRIELGDVGYLDEYFRCLFIKVVPVRCIIKARRAARSMFGCRDTAYMPHVSLMYGRLPADAGKRLATDLASLVGQHLHVRSLALYHVNGAPREWKCIRRFSLK